MHISSKLKRRRLMGGVAGLTLFVCTWTFLIDTFRLPIPLFDSPSPISCHYATLDGEILNTENLDFSPPAVKSIFFHVTSCHANASIHLSPRQACAVESAAMMNPGYKVYVLFAGPVLANTSSNLTDQLLAYGNVEFYRVYLPAYARKTPVEALILNGKVVGSRYALYHTSDVLRYLTMWKFGGVYLDLDVVVVRSLEGLPGSFTGMEEPGVVAAGAMAFDNSFSGRFFAEKCMKELANSFSDTDWTNNGPGVLKRVLQRYCPDPWPPQTCLGFRVFKPEYLYPVFWKKWRWYMEKAEPDALNSMSSAYIHHVWNKLSSEVPKAHPQSPYSQLARDFCPKVYEITKDYF